METGMADVQDHSVVAVVPIKPNLLVQRVGSGTNHRETTSSSKFVIFVLFVRRTAIAGSKPSAPASEVFRCENHAGNTEEYFPP